MTTRHYIAVADLAPSERMWSIVFPDFPGVTSAAAEFADVPQQARDALATAVEDIVAEGEGLPPRSRKDDAPRPIRQSFMIYATSWFPWRCRRVPRASTSASTGAC